MRDLPTSEGAEDPDESRVSIRFCAPSVATTVGAEHSDVAGGFSTPTVKPRMNFS